VPPFADQDQRNVNSCFHAAPDRTKKNILTLVGLFHRADGDKPVRPHFRPEAPGS
jgi:hypothetical protein